MLQSNILVLARQGQVEAITDALNHVLQTLTVTGRAIIESEKIVFYCHQARRYSTSNSC
ncbi:hypothetical protein [Acaryochloris sp. 'Moss Beach']|uniref:hypothetical protein n=1 Tax=Acaryochloris sp. 'Moss Beach' TaxID=2740837 RepID=UPI001F1626C7|nr:hypothetical protein [Acaryochloris sp. 'Moss Beach']